MTGRRKNQASSLNLMEVGDLAGERRRLSLRQIEVFRAVMLSGSLNGAANVLHVAQPSLSRVVKRTEDVLNFKLFERVRGRLIPTKEAGALLTLVNRVYRQLDELGDAVDKMTMGEGSVFKLGCTGSPGRCLVPRVVAAMRTALPKLNFQVDVLLFEQIIDYLLFQRGECVVSVFPIRHPLVESRSVRTGRLVALIPKTHPLAKRRQVTVQQLAKEPLISFDPMTPHGAAVSQMFESTGHEPQICVLIRHIETAVSLVANGVGIAIVDEFSVADEWDMPLAVVPLANSLPLHIYLSWHKDVVRSQYFKRFESLCAKVPLQAHRSK
ncbi:LysR family transcriptional regulator [Bradyrhizobium tropiciagri]|uniref:LysR family transcriptional regulator n=1 Tax=Bradyrhizobium tropiciagri TaxID=312253 RepID=UPI0020114F25|nr:LysR family transcriptional regulator [Bradyrhizobium tropiciagri]